MRGSPVVRGSDGLSASDSPSRPLSGDLTTEVSPGDLYPAPARGSLPSAQQSNTRLSSAITFSDVVVEVEERSRLAKHMQRASSTKSKLLEHIHRFISLVYSSAVAGAGDMLKSNSLGCGPRSMSDVFSVLRTISAPQIAPGRHGLGVEVHTGVGVPVGTPPPLSRHSTSSSFEPTQTQFFSEVEMQLRSGDGFVVSTRHQAMLRCVQADECVLRFPRRES
jgi:hypothetical protein